MLSIFALTLATLVSTPAYAVDTYPASMCTQDSGGTVDVDSYGRIANSSSTSTLYVVCPVVAEPTTTSSSAALFVVDRHYTSDISCTARYYNSGGSFSASSAATSTGSSSSSQTLSPAEPSYSYTFTSRVFYCSIPATYTGNSSLIQLYRR